jgi:tetratricopeptide (TPR) repeat protein
MQKMIAWFLRVSASPRLRVLSAAAVCLLTAAGWYGWQRWHVPPPPAVERSGLDPAAATAIDEATAAVKESPRSAAAWGHLGMVLQAHNFTPEAAACYARAESLDPSAARWPYLHALALFGGDPDVTLAQLRRAAETAADVPVVRCRLGETLLALDRPDEAEPHFRAVLARHADDARALLGLARVAYDRGDWQRSLEYLQRSARSQPSFKATHALTAEVQARLGNPAAAAAAARLAAGLPESTWPDTYLDEVERLYTGVEARIKRALALHERGQWDEAVRLLYAAVRDNPQSYRSLVAQGMVLTAQGAFAAAERPLREALRVRPDGFDAYVGLGASLRSQGEFARAADCFRKAAALNPLHAVAYHNLGLCLSDLGNGEEAVAALRAAVRCKPEFADAHRDLGELLAKAGRRAEALRHFEDAVRLAPADEKARRAAERLRAEQGQHRPAENSDKRSPNNP